jgi:hypothetical protein
MKHPYANLPDHAYWRRSVVGRDRLDPMAESPFRFHPDAAAATAGSCFAQYIGRRLQAAQCHFLQTESPHPLMNEFAATRLNYGVYSARYGNIYTARQLLQLFDRAYGWLQPVEDVWSEPQGRIIDPFRPSIQPGGFNSRRELNIDRERHYRAVRQMFEKLDIFIFTLGLTEAWRARADGVVFPVCPGVSGGVFKKAKHEFVNFSVDEVVADIRAFFQKLRTVNRRARMILSVSPVPLAATAEQRHVVISTMASKSILRVACDVLSRDADIAYFPAYEIIAGGYLGKDYFAPDRRSVSKEGVDCVMEVFFRHFLEKKTFGQRTLEKAATFLSKRQVSNHNRIDKVAAAFDVICDEAALDLE